MAGRYAVKPYYVKGKGESLPAVPVVYLSLARLLPYGEFQDDASMSRPRKKLEQSYIDDLASMYRDVTGLDASSFTISEFTICPVIHKSAAASRGRHGICRFRRIEFSVNLTDFCLCFDF